MPLKPPRTRYARSGDLHIAYQVVGDGPMDLVVVPGWVSNVEWSWESPFWAGVFERFSAFARLILWDKRGTGLSDPVEGVPTLDERVDDLEAVMEAAGSQQAALFGVSEGGPMALLLAATRPERVSALVLYGTSPRFVTSPDWDFGWTPADLGALLTDIEENWGGGAMLQVFGPSVADNELARLLGLEVRAGLHTGEIELRGDDIAGVAVHIGARVAALAGAGQVLVSSAVPPLVAGSGLEFSDRGCRELKGLEGEWRIFAAAR